MQQLRPQLFAAAEILQLDICQLQSYITTALLENPVLECGEAPGVSLLGDLTGTGSASGMGKRTALPCRRQTLQTPARSPTGRT